MATSRTRVNLPLVLRATNFHRNATAPLHRQQSPHRYYHISPTSFLHSHPSKILLSNPHLFSTFLYRHVRPRTTAHSNPQNLPSISNLSIPNQHLVSRSVHTRATALHKHQRTYNILNYALTLAGIAAAGGLIFWYRKLMKPRIFATMSDKLEIRFHCVIPHMYRMGHVVVVEGLARPMNARVKGYWELYFSATEVLDLRHHVVTALRRNNTIFALNEIYSEGNKEILPATNRLTTCVDEITTTADDLSKSEPKMLKLDPKYDSKITEKVLFVFYKFPDFPKWLKQGHSVFIMGVTIPASKSDVFDEIKKVIRSGEWRKSVTGNTGKNAYQYLAYAIAKDDERYMPPEAAAAIGRNARE